MPIESKSPPVDNERVQLRLEAELVQRFGFVLKTAEVAEVLRLSQSSVLQIPRGELPRGEGRGPRARYLASDVAAYAVQWTKG